MSFQHDIIDFRNKYGLTIPHCPHHITHDVFSFRVGHLQEELDELREAYSKCYSDHDENCSQDLLNNITDALVDLTYIAIGTAVGMGVNFEECWNEVHKANMAKVRAKPDGSDSKRGHKNDIVKPPGWTEPDLSKAMYVSMIEKPSILLRAHQIINERSEEGHRQYGSMEDNMDDAATIASVISDKKIDPSDVLACLIGLKFSRHRNSYKQDNLLDAVAYIGALDNHLRGEEE